MEVAAMIKVYDPQRVRSAAAMRGGDTRMAVAVRATAEPQAPATSKEGGRKEAAALLFARLALVVFVAVPWLCGLLWLAWSLAS
jgi:hypothetical protein